MFPCWGFRVLSTPDEVRGYLIPCFPNLLGSIQTVITLICLMLALINLCFRQWHFFDYFSEFWNVPPVWVFNHPSTRYRCRRLRQLDSICSQRKGTRSHVTVYYRNTPCTLCQLNGPSLTSPGFLRLHHWHPPPPSLSPCLPWFLHSRPLFQAGWPFPSLPCSQCMGADPGLLGSE